MSLTSISPIDGRYAKQTAPLANTFSEYGLIKHRLIVECRWLIALSQTAAINEVPELSQQALSIIEDIITNFDVNEAEKVKTIEATTNHDLKAVEYYLKQQFEPHAELNAVSEFIHFACTSEDINNLAYGLMLKQAHMTILPQNLKSLLGQIEQFAIDNADQPMLSRTHGQSATPTTVGKEFANIAYRLQRQLKQLDQLDILGKFNGAVGNFNAHVTSFPNIDWPAVCEGFVNSLGLTWNPYTTQIEPHDYIAEMSHQLSRINTILIDFCRDNWQYISLGYFKQKVKQGEVGSSTMPHKVNPIDFENAEGNLGIANAFFEHFSTKLPISRWQRDLSDSTVLRNLGTAFAYCLLAYNSLQKGLKKIDINSDVVAADLADRWELLAEPLQTVMRRYGIEKPYEKLKELSRGKKVTQNTLHEFINQLDLPESAKKDLLALTPLNYIGLATKLAKNITKD